MRKIILMMLLIVMSSSAMAEWDKFGRTEKFDDYIDPSSIIKTGNMAAVLNLRDYKTPESFGEITFQSVIERRQFNCKNSKVRLLNVYFYAEHMGVKEIYSQLDPTPWRSIDGKGENYTFEQSCGMN